MSLRHRSVLLLVSGILALSLLSGSAGDSAAGPITREYCIVPDMITIAPDGSFACRMLIAGTAGPVVGSYVELEFTAEAASLIAWTDPVPAGADTASGVGIYGGPIFVRTTDANGEVFFHLAGAGCVAQKNPADPVEPFIVQVRADNFLLNESGVNSPDAVDKDGFLPEFLGYSVCDPATGTTSVGLADALYHTPQIKQGTIEICTKFSAPYTDGVGLGDAGLLTPYVKAGTAGSCVYTGP